MKILDVAIYKLMMTPVLIWEFTDDKKIRENIDWLDWRTEMTCYKMRTNRLIRWLKCHHKWRTFDADDTSWCFGRYVIYGELRYDAKKIKVCDKCGEVRTVGKGERIIW